MPKKVWLGYPPTHKTFHPYVTAIGQAAVAWNGLHEALRGLFWTLLGVDAPVHSAIWYAIRSDRTQRQILDAIVKRIHETGDISDSILDRVEWLLKNANSLATARDDAIHVPLISWGRPPNHTVVPGSSHGHPMGKRLENKDLVNEFRWCRDMGIALTDYCLRLDWHLNNQQQFPLPNKPALPNRGQQKTPRGQHRPPPPKSPVPPLPAFRGR